MHHTICFALLDSVALALSPCYRMHLYIHVGVCEKTVPEKNALGNISLQND